ncbi:IMS domain-containing protein [Calothrix sp. PCC 6303]|uniref:IMS domain-containing protein n=1 Tax=Calothrix sp. PCC 6303 TaxID=1170562 RepID=UPI0002A02FCB|nr:IMS domain-containing protein [Calothrix sp. PCC 6303]AFZ02412.1 heat shock protein DnaJ domain protein [Calothrix sp. PCC 6303]
MRIPLDYYRILGLPLAASEEQLRQAYGDRRQQLPRREYSHAAITSRKQLIEEAYVILSDPQERKIYDQLYLSHAYAPDGDQDVAIAVEERLNESNGKIPDNQVLSIDINQDELVGALLLLQELGEYEQVLKLGRPYLVNKSGSGGNNSTQTGFERELETAPSERPDVVLTIALACLELGREQWQQGFYENAAVSLETGAEFLVREGLFESVQAEIQADLYRLRPYRILELLALPEANQAEHQQGLELLQEILDERGGIDGSGNDSSGLSVDDFLRFIQQLRHNLTVAEQHKLFEAESKRPSAVATYLAVYALIARGFTQRQPALIRQAKQMLTRLGKRQDVHLEQSLCALLLGQTEEATRALELSQEYEAIAFIREHSQDSPDLLPGLCLYGERWLQNEVFPHYRDLVNQTALLKNYFADEQVQSYLEGLPTDAQAIPEPRTRQPFTTNQPGSSRYSNSQINSRPTSYSSSQEAVNNYTPVNEPNPVRNPQRINLDTTPTPGKTRRTSPSTNSPNPTNTVSRRVPRRRQAPRSRSNKNIRLLFAILASAAGLFIFWLVLSTTFGFLKNLFSPEAKLSGEQLTISLNEPVIPIPDPNSPPKSAEGSLTKDAAKEIIQNWLSTKGAALGTNHEIESLNTILTEPALSQWRAIALQVKSTFNYRQYDHSISTVSVEDNSPDQNNVSVEAVVNETTTYYENEQVKNTSREKVRVRYVFTRVDNAWRIRNMSVLNTVNLGRG